MKPNTHPLTPSHSESTPNSPRAWLISSTPGGWAASQGGCIFSATGMESLSFRSAVRTALPLKQMLLQFTSLWQESQGIFLGALGFLFITPVSLKKTTRPFWWGFLIFSLHTVSSSHLPLGAFLISITFWWSQRWSSTFCHLETGGNEFSESSMSFTWLGKKEWLNIQLVLNGFSMIYMDGRRNVLIKHSENPLKTDEHKGKHHRSKLPIGGAILVSSGSLLLQWKELRTTIGPKNRCHLS